MPFSIESNLEWRKSPDADGVMIGEAMRDGPTVGIIGGIHGDEFSGIVIADLIPKSLSVDFGRVIVMHGNLDAIAIEKRQSNPDNPEANLNRWFRDLTDEEKLRDGGELPSEANRAQELMGHIDMCDAILDLHEFEDPNGTPFIITERDSLATAQAIGPEVIALGFAEAEPGGTDGYGYENEIEALCYELGPMGKQFTAKNVKYAKGAVNRFLAAQALLRQGMAAKLPPLHDNPMLVQVDKDSPYIRVGDTFEMERDFTSFERLKRGELLATDYGKEIRSSEDVDQVMVFPKPKATPPKKGREAFELGEIVTE